jgi:quercetin dioxygenase-like cupin family protein
MSQVVRAGEQLDGPTGPMPGMSGSWLNGPTQDHNLDVGIIGFEAGVVTPPHVHHVGQVLVVLSGDGFVEVAGERTTISAGDIVITPAGEWHTHGAGPDGPMSHLSVTTGRNEARLAP